MRDRAIHGGLAGASLFFLCLVPGGAQQAAAPAPAAKPGQTYGHSMQGEAFNEGPRQKAYLMRGMAKITFPVTTKNPKAQKFIEQGIAQLHAYWYFEAERSFRQAAALDPDCAMAYWGMAMANVNNETRAKGFLQRAMELREKASDREKGWIESLNAYYSVASDVKDRDKVRRANFARGMEQLVAKHPDDLEAKVFLAHWYYQHQNDEPKRKRDEIDKMMNEVLAKAPLHPIHHYRIHLWNYNDDKKALNSAALCGPSDSGIAHMWHMPGHTYSQLHRYADAAYYQEASARVDHAHMMRDRVLPDQIHNYAHNNQWLVETLEFVGRVHDAIDLAVNMIGLPRHPRYNTMNGSGSGSQGRLRLMETLFTYELWEEALALDKQGLIEPTADRTRQIERRKLLGIASFMTGDAAGGHSHLLALEEMKSAPKPEEKDKKKESASPDTVLLEALAEARGYAALTQSNLEEAKKQFDQVKSLPRLRESRIRLALGQTEKALELAQGAMQGAANRAAPLATLVEVLYRSGKREEAQKQFEELRKVASSADLDIPFFARLAPLAKEFRLPTDWRVPVPPASDTGERPRLSSLGPFRWTPVSAPGFHLEDTDGTAVSLDTYREQGKPVVVLFYLGFGCEQCLKQLHAFAPLYYDFEKAGIGLVAISTDTKEALRKAASKPDTKTRFPFPLLPDPQAKVFKAYRAYDDFEGMPLHGAFLVDGNGRVRWQDIGFQPFQDAAFLLAEAQRLLAQNPNPSRLRVHRKNRPSAPGLSAASR